MFRKMMIFVLLVLMVCLAAILILRLWWDYSETVENYYAHYVDLKEVGEPGNWIPSLISPSAVEIREKHKIDTGTGILRFHYPKSQDLSLAGYCEKVTMASVRLPQEKFLNVFWWPRELFGDHPRSNGIEQYEFYVCIPQQAFLAVKKADDHYQAFYWTR